MESLSVKAIAASKPFRFLVGPEEFEFSIHSVLVARQSPVLDALVNRGFKETTDACVRWPDIDERTFTSFWQYVYAGDYVVPKIVGEVADSVSEKSEDTEPADPMMLEQFSFQGQPPIIDRAVEPTGSIAEDWPKVYYSKEADAATYWNVTEKGPRNPPMHKRKQAWDCFRLLYQAPASFKQDKTAHESTRGSDMFAHHARVHIFADRYGISRLMTLSLEKLHDALVQDHLHENSISDTISLLRASYEEGAPDNLKRITSRFAACHVEMLSMHQDFQNVLEESPGLAKDLLNSMLPRLE